jgi:hypothetical protein
MALADRGGAAAGAGAGGAVGLPTAGAGLDGAPYGEIPNVGRASGIGVPDDEIGVPDDEIGGPPDEKLGVWGTEPAGGACSASELASGWARTTRFVGLVGRTATPSDPFVTRFDTWNW